MLLKIVLFITLSLQTFAQANEKQCAITFAESNSQTLSKTALNEIQLLHQSIINETNPVIRTLLTQKRDALIKELVSQNPNFKIELKEAPQKVSEKTTVSAREIEAKKLRKKVDPKIFKQSFTTKEEIRLLEWSDSGREVFISTYKGYTLILNLAEGNITSVEGNLMKTFGGNFIVYNGTLNKTVIFTIEELNEVARFDGYPQRKDHGLPHLMPMYANGKLTVVDLKLNKEVYTHSETLTTDGFNVDVFADRIVIVKPNAVEIFDWQNKKHITTISGWAQVSDNGKWIVKKNPNADGVIYDGKTGEELFTFTKDVVNSYIQEDMVLLRIGLISNQKWTLIDLAKGEVLVDGMFGEDPHLFASSNKVSYFKKSWLGTKQLEIFDLATGVSTSVEAERVYSKNESQGLLAIGSKIRNSDPGPLRFQVYDINSQQIVYQVEGQTPHGGIYFMPAKNIVSVDLGNNIEFLYDLKSQRQFANFKRWKKEASVTSNPQHSHVLVPTANNEFSFFAIKDKP